MQCYFVRPDVYHLCKTLTSMISPIITDLTNIKVIRTFEFRKDQID